MSEYTRTRDEMALAERLAKAHSIIRAFAIAYVADTLNREPSEPMRRAGKRAIAYAGRNGL